MAESQASIKKQFCLNMNQAIHRRFKKICEREKESMSQKHESWEARYVSVHETGNPQLNLEKFIGDVRKKCFRCEGLFPNLEKVKFISGMHGFVCPDCKQNYEERRLIKG